MSAKHIPLLDRISLIVDSIRIDWLIAIRNLHPNINIARNVYFGKGVRILLNPDGDKTGGTVTIGARSRIADGVVIAPYGGNILIDENVYIGPNSVIYGHGGLRIGRNTMIAANCVIIPANHRFGDRLKSISAQGENRLGIEIQTDVWIGSGVQILDGVCVATGAVIGAGSVVTKSVEPYSVSVGVPARIIRHRGEADG